MSLYRIQLDYSGNPIAAEHVSKRSDIVGSWAYGTYTYTKSGDYSFWLTLKQALWIWDYDDPRVPRDLMGDYRDVDKKPEARIMYRGPTTKNQNSDIESPKDSVYPHKQYALGDLSRTYGRH
jgi:hypothetical protein